MATLFFSYSHKDEQLRNELEVHLALLKRQGVITTWHDRRILAGSVIDSNISAELENAQIILLLVSADFLASDYCFEREMLRAMELNDAGRTRVIPVIAHPCDWHSAPFGKLRATPTDGKPISMFANPQEALSIVAKDVRSILEAMEVTRKPNVPAPIPATDKLAASPPHPRSSNLRVRRKFDDHERDQFLENTYEYIARYFDISLSELAARNQHLKIRFKRIDGRRFSAAIYNDGDRATQCSVTHRTGSHAFGNGIAYSTSENDAGNSFNALISVTDDGYAMSLSSTGFTFSGAGEKEVLSQEGAAEHFWGLFLSPLQQR